MEADLKTMSPAELQKLWDRKRRELYEIKKVLDERKGEVNPVVNIDFEKYITK